MQALDTYEYVTDFESAADHTVTLEKFQEMHMPMSLPAKLSYSSNFAPRHQSPFESLVDNTEASEGLTQAGAKQYRHSGPWLADLTQAEFTDYLNRVRRQKPELLQKLRERLEAKRFAEVRKQAQDEGQDLEALVPPQVTDEEFHTYLKYLREDPFSFGPVLFELFDLPSAPAVPSERIGGKYYQSPATKLSAIEYAVNGPPKTHPSAGLSYSRTHAVIYNHPEYGPQGFQRPVEARILRPKGRFKGRAAKAVAGIGGIAVEDLNAQTFVDMGAPAGLAWFDATIPGGAKYWVNPIRASVDSDGRIGLSSYRATASSKAPYGIQDYRKPNTMSISEAAQRDARFVPRLDRPRYDAKPSVDGAGNRPVASKEAVAKSLMDTLNASSRKQDKQS